MAQRRFLATSRAYESSADQYALTVLEQAKINPDGLARFMDKLGREELLPSSQQSEYVRTHPLTRNRIEAIEIRAGESAYSGTKTPEAWQAQHDRMMAKLLGFITPQQVAWVYDDRDTSIPALYARTVAAYRQNRVEEALSLADTLIGQEPDNAYFHELKGQMLVDFGRIRKAIPSYEKAMSAMPEAGPDSHRPGPCPDRNPPETSRTS